MGEKYSTLGIGECQANPVRHSNFHFEKKHTLLLARIAKSEAVLAGFGNPAKPY
jgi:hypothetical protein